MRHVVSMRDESVSVTSRPSYSQVKKPRYQLNLKLVGLTAGLIVVEDRTTYCPYRESNHHSKVVLVPIPNELTCLSNIGISYNVLSVIQRRCASRTLGIQNNTQLGLHTYRHGIYYCPFRYIQQAEQISSVQVGSSPSAETEKPGRQVAEDTSLCREVLTAANNQLQYVRVGRDHVYC
jgi:hypothetical protein